MPRPRCLAMSTPPGAENGRETGGAMRWRLRRWLRWRWRRHEPLLDRRKRCATIVARALLGGRHARRGRFAWRRRDHCPIPAAVLSRRGALEFFPQRPLGLLGCDLNAFDQRGI